MTQDTAGPAPDVSLGLTSVQALDAAFAGIPCRVVRADGSTKALAVHHWRGEASSSDHALFVDQCTGPTLDVGCGPGRLTTAVARRGIEAVGVDISAEAVRLARIRGAAAVWQDVFEDLPSRRRWQHVLLADGNIGLGGDPVRLLHRVADLLHPSGTALVELAGPGVQHGRERIRLQVGSRVSDPFLWATVGVDQIGDMAAAADLAVTEVRSLSGRHVATLQHVDG